MKIVPYSSVIQGQKQDHVRRSPRRETESASHTNLEPGSTKSFRDVVEIVSLENKRALAEDPPRDLGAAEFILEKAKGALGQMSRQDLGKIHRLEGLVHVYPA